MMLPALTNLKRDRILIVKDPGNLAQYIRGRYPCLDVYVSHNYLSGISDLSKSPVRGLLVGIEPSMRKLDIAIAGLRKAAGANSRLVLCCLPSGEPTAKAVLSAGADDYIIYPPSGDELDQALNLKTPYHDLNETTNSASPSWDELSTFTQLLSEISTGKKHIMEKMCQLISSSLRSPSVCIIVGNDITQVGESGFEPILVEAIEAAGRNFGKIFIGPRQRSPYSTAEAQKLRHYGHLTAQLLEAADQQQQWQNLAMIDETTQLPNRRYLLQMMEMILQRAAVERFQITVLIFDLDGFKHFNDTYGHAAGDQILYETGQLFRKNCRQHDIVARYAGDEFIVVFWDAEEPRIAGSKHPTNALDVLHRFKKELESHEFPKLGPEAKGGITISGGLASYPWDAKNTRDLINKADEALLQAKRHGKNLIYLVGSEGKPIKESEANSNNLSM